MVINPLMPNNAGQNWAASLTAGGTPAPGLPLDWQVLVDVTTPGSAAITGQGSALAAGSLGGVLALSGLAWFTNLRTVLLAAFALVTYVLVYTPLKRITPWAVYVGAVPGAIPPVLGWAAVTGGIDAHALLLFLIIFTWTPACWQARTAVIASCLGGSIIACRPRKVRPSFTSA